MSGLGAMFGAVRTLLLCCLCSVAMAAPQTGWYWNPNESGRGFFVESHDGVTFIGAYLYDGDGHATWLVSGGPNADPYNWTGDLYNKSNGQTLFGSYVSPGSASVVGQLSIHFSDDTHATLTWPGGQVAIEREIFGSGDAPFQPLAGWWWNPAESGSGFSVEVQGSNLFMVGFMYDDSGRPIWYFSAGPMSSPTTYHGDVLLFANGQTMGGAYRPPGPPNTIGAVDIEFAATNAATLTFTEASASAAKRTNVKAGQSSTRSVQPQFPKPGTFQYPQFYVGSFVLRSQLPGGLAWSLYSHENVTLSQGSFTPAVATEYVPARAGYLMGVDLNGNYDVCSVSAPTIDVDITPSILDLLVTSYGAYSITFTFPAVVANATITCQGDSPQTVPLPFPGQTVTLNAAIPNVDLTGTRTGVTPGEVSANGKQIFPGGAVAYYSFDFVPHY